MPDILCIGNHFRFTISCCLSGFKPKFKDSKLNLWKGCTIEDSYELLFKSLNHNISCYVALKFHSASCQLASDKKRRQDF